VILNTCNGPKPGGYRALLHCGYWPSVSSGLAALRFAKFGGRVFLVVCAGRKHRGEFYTAI
jgi:hypothetical protein